MKEQDTNITAYEKFSHNAKWTQTIHFSKTNDWPKSCIGRFLVTHKQQAAIWPPSQSPDHSKKRFLSAAAKFYIATVNFPFHNFLKQFQCLSPRLWARMYRHPINETRLGVPQDVRHTTEVQGIATEQDRIWRDESEATWRPDEPSRADDRSRSSLDKSRQRRSAKFGRPSLKTVLSFRA